MGEGGGGGIYTSLFYFWDLTSGLLRKILYYPAFTFSTFFKLSLTMWPLPLVMITLLVGATHDKVEGQFEIQMEAEGKYS